MYTFSQQCIQYVGLMQVLADVDGGEHILNVFAHVGLTSNS